MSCRIAIIRQRRDQQRLQLAQAAKLQSTCRVHCPQPPRLTLISKLADGFRQGRNNGPPEGWQEGLAYRRRRPMGLIAAARERACAPSMTIRKPVGFRDGGLARKAERGFVRPRAQRTHGFWGSPASLWTPFTMAAPTRWLHWEMRSFRLVSKSPRVPEPLAVVQER
jgi:hypothetical protein